jgi:hypothetical protein
MTARYALLVLTAACVDQPVAVPPFGGGAPVDRLSQLHLFAGDPAAQLPATGVTPYDVIAPLWSDGASKSRFIAAPMPLQATDDAWNVPAGTYLVKTFFFPRDERDRDAGVQLIETRVLAFTDAGTLAATYVWNAAQTDAVTSGGNLDVPVHWIDASGLARTHVHHVPGVSQCDSCHAGGALGLRTPQLAEQLDALVAAGVVDRAPTGIEPFVDPYGNAPLQARALSYLDVNCAHCHRPGGDAASTHADWRRDHVLANVCREARHDVDGRHLVIAPGKPDQSVAIVRMRSSDPFVHMPRGPSHVIDARALAMLEEWITSLAGCP